MRLNLDEITDLATLPHDEIIDVRSPAEFAEDHLPGAVNLPVLDDAERARVGTIYVQEEPFRARKIGAALVARNAARHIEGPLADRPGGWRPLVYCWRGGQRSGSFATILAQIGWRVSVLEGGYAAWRRLVVRALYQRALPFRVVLIDGDTCSGKTALLDGLAAAGYQVIDLEALANHRGSLLGPRAGGQPAQKRFETALAMQLAALSPDRPLILEAESSRIGDLRLPPALWAAMKAAPRLRLSAPLAERARHAVARYPDLLADAAALDARLGGLVPFHGHDRVEAWKAMAAAGAFEPLAAELMAAHYDPRYARQRERFGALAEERLTLDRLDAEGLAMALPRAVAALARLAAAEAVPPGQSASGVS
ncbi:MAG: tRNA 2-selenouridine(34) synthase MnmH [Alphaproteobacteria bacterium HGW-Alphaproteobacteria-2]|nr:MAG: tRNA 2-selenouridine(34) synthase MnmH [Alphaproteobacteria bacterium HGW-Alphaproteobacteria-2]